MQRLFAETAKRKEETGKMERRTRKRHRNRINKGHRKSKREGGTQKARRTIRQISSIAKETKKNKDIGRGRQQGEKEDTEERQETGGEIEKKGG